MAGWLWGENDCRVFVGVILMMGRCDCRVFVRVVHVR